MRGSRRKGHKGRIASDFSIQIGANEDNVYFDRIYAGPKGDEKLFLIMTSRETAYKLGKWLVKNCG